MCNSLNGVVLGLGASISVLCGAAYADGGNAGRPAEPLLAGEITRQSVDRVLNELQSRQNSKPLILRVNSPGGDARSAMRLATIIHERNIDVRVERICAAVCAQYVMPAAHRVTFEKDAIPIFAQMPSSQMYSGLAAKVGSANLTEDDRQELANELSVLKRLLVEQDQFYRRIGVDPSRMYRTMDIWTEVNLHLRRSNSAQKRVAIVPDSSFLQRCLRLPNVEWRSLTRDDSKLLANMGKTPLAVTINGEVYFDGLKIPMSRIEC